MLCRVALATCGNVNLSAGFKEFKAGVKYIVLSCNVGGDYKWAVGYILITKAQEVVCRVRIVVSAAKRLNSS